MMIETLQHERAQDAMPKIEALKKLKEEIEKEQLHEQEITKIREIPSRQDKRYVKRAKRFKSSRLNRRWWQRMNLDETYRSPSHFTWRY